MRVGSQQQVPDLMCDGMAQESAVVQTADSRPSLFRVSEDRNVGATFRRDCSVAELLALHRQLGQEDPEDEIGGSERSGAGWRASLSPVCEALEKLDPHTSLAEDPFRGATTSLRALAGSFT